MTLVTVSRDTKFVHLAWHRHEKSLKDVRYLMGSDPTGNVARIFGVLDEGSGLALRGTYVISPTGQLLNTEMNFYNLGRNIDELLRKVKANIHLGRHPQHACPAKWKDEGDKTLIGSAKLVGKVHEEMTSGDPAPGEAQKPTDSKAKAAPADAKAKAAPGKK